MTKKGVFDAQPLIDDQVAGIDEALGTIDEKLGKYEKLMADKNKLLSARRALLGTGSRMTSNAGTRVTIDDVVASLKKDPGQTPSQLAEEFSVKVTTINSHLHRNKDRFITKNSKYWARDPKNGLNTADDIEEDDE